MLNAEKLNEGFLTLESFRLVNADIIAEGLKLVAFVLVVKFGYSNHRRCRCRCRRDLVEEVY